MLEEMIRAPLIAHGKEAGNLRRNGDIGPQYHAHITHIDTLTRLARTSYPARYWTDEEMQQRAIDYLRRIVSRIEASMSSDPTEAEREELNRAGANLSRALMKLKTITEGR